MAAITLKGNPVHTVGELPKVGSTAPDFKLTKGDLSDVSLADFAGKVRILNIVPSLDTSTCALSAKRFNEEIKKLSGAVVLNVSRDLPFAQARFCKAEGVDAVVPLSVLRDLSFGDAYGVTMVDGPLAGLLSRSVVVVDGKGKVVYTQQVSEIGKEPDYAAAIAAVEKALKAIADGAGRRGRARLSRRRERARRSSGALPGAQRKGRALSRAPRRAKLVALERLGEELDPERGSSPPSFAEAEAPSGAAASTSQFAIWALLACPLWSMWRALTRCANEGTLSSAAGISNAKSATGCGSGEAGGLSPKTLEGRSGFRAARSTTR
jgi:thiol peroxidase